MRHWRAGWRYTHPSGITLRVEQGKKAADDLRMDIFVGRWVPIPMAFGAILADFFYENEEVLYPPRGDAGPKGGKKYLDYLQGAAYVGWEAAESYLQDEKEAARQRRQQ